LAVRVGGAAPETGAGARALPGGAQHHPPAAPGAGWSRIRRISLIGQIRLNRPRLQSCGAQLLAVAAGLDEPLLERANSLVQKVVGLVDQTDQRVGNHGRIAVLKPPRVGLRRIGPIDRISRTRAMCGAHRAGFRVLLGPSQETSLAEVVFIVQQQLIKTRPGDPDQLELALAGSCCGAAALGDVLAPAASRLHHLVVSARALVHETIAESHCGVVDDLRDLEGAQPPVTPVRPECAVTVRSDESVRSVRSFGTVGHGAPVIPVSGTAGSPP